MAERLTGEMLELQRRVDASAAEAAGHSADLSECEQQQATAAAAHLDELNLQKSTARDRHAACESNLAEHKDGAEKESVACVRELALAQSETSAIQGDVVKNAEALGSCNADLASVKNELESAASLCHEKESAELQQLESKVLAANEKIDSRNIKLQNCGEELNIAVDRFDECQSSIGEQCPAAGPLKTKVANLEETVQKQADSIKELKRSLKDALTKAARIPAIEGQVSELQTSLSGSGAELRMKNWVLFGSGCSVLLVGSVLGVLVK